MEGIEERIWGTLGVPKSQEYGGEIHRSHRSPQVTRILNGKRAGPGSRLLPPRRGLGLVCIYFAMLEEIKTRGRGHLLSPSHGGSEVVRSIIVRSGLLEKRGQCHVRLLQLPAKPSGRKP